MLMPRGFAAIVAVGAILCGALSAPLVHVHQAQTDASSDHDHGASNIRHAHISGHTRPDRPHGAQRIAVRPDDRHGHTVRNADDFVFPSARAAYSAAPPVPVTVAEPLLRPRPLPVRRPADVRVHGPPDLDRLPPRAPPVSHVATL